MTAQTKSIFGEYEGAMVRQIEEERRMASMADDYPTQLPQHFGKRVAYMTMKNGNVEVTICNSSRKQIGRTVVLKSLFAGRPTESNEAEVEWACRVAGISMK
jgi:hypothetical protein